MANLDDFIPEFTGQRASEKIEAILFKHWFVVVLPILKAIGIIILSFALPIWLHWAGWIFSYGITTLIYYSWMVFWVCYIVYAYILWYRDRFIITSERIVDIDQKGLFTRKVSEIELEKVQNITHTVAGLFATMFNFGTVVVQSAGANDLTLDHISDPAGIQEEITRLVKVASSDQPVSANELINFIKSKRE